MAGNSTGNPLKADPTQTITLRRRFRISLWQGTKTLITDLQQVVSNEDAFGLDVRTTEVSPVVIGANVHRWRFASVPTQVEAFSNWLGNQLEGIFFGMNYQMAWKRSAQEAFVRGLQRAHKDLLQRDGSDMGPAFNQQFAQVLMSQVNTQDVLRLLLHQVEREVQGFVNQLQTQLVRVVASELVGAPVAARVCKRLLDVVRVSRNKLFAIVNTETIRLHAEGQLLTYESLGEKSVQLLVEHLVVGDVGEVCPQCRKTASKAVAVQKAHGMIPLHPNCRCCWIPVAVSEAKR